MISSSIVVAFKSDSFMSWPAFICWESSKQTSWCYALNNACTISKMTPFYAVKSMFVIVSTMVSWNNWLSSEMHYLYRKLVISLAATKKSYTSSKKHIPICYMFAIFCENRFSSSDIVFCPIASPTALKRVEYVSLTKQANSQTSWLIGCTLLMKSSLLHGLIVLFPEFWLWG